VVEQSCIKIWENYKWHPTGTWPSYTAKLGLQNDIYVTRKYLL